MSYANIASIREEIAYSKRLFEEHGWPIIDVTRRSVEEITALIIQLLHKDRDVQELFF
jgi:regulator of PEP synthase PpsR (kinase-PPPase family)